MKWLFLSSMVCTLSACGHNSTGHDHDLSVGSGDGGEDLGMSSDGGGDGSSSDDMLNGPDLDNHLPLKLVPDAVPMSTSGGVDYYEMHVKEGLEQVLPSGPMTPVWGFNGQWPGPTIHATLGRPVTLRVFNELPVNEAITIHNHGHNVDARYDGHPSAFNIWPSPSPSPYYDYHYNNTQAGGTDPDFEGAGTYFFHDHELSQTAHHFYMGIEAFYLIHPKAGSAEAGLNLPSGAFDIPLMIQDRSFNGDNSLGYPVNVITGFQGATLVVNATPHPYLNVSRRKYRFRMLNASNARRFDVGLSRGSMYQIGTDGGLLPTRLTPAKIPMAPAERVEIIIDFAQYKIGDVITLTNDDPFTPPQPEILQFRVTSDASPTDTSSAPGTLNTLFTQYTESTPAVTRERMLSFDIAAGDWTLNGKKYDPAQWEFKDTQLGDVEIWNLINNSTTQPIPHPFHQHLVQFQILSVCPNTTSMCGVAPPDTQRGWKDTVLVPPASTVRVKMQFYYTGPEEAAGTTSTIFPGTAGYVFHCHNLEHEDQAMMLQQLVSPSPSPH